jgi:predicted metal-dependent phosphotriesterase family hydrolase
MTAGPATACPHKFGTVRTVLGDIPSERLGRCDYHEHLFQVSQLLVGDELDDEQASMQEAESLRRGGIDALIDATPTGLGRNPRGVARISLPRRFLPRLRDRLGSEVVDRLLIENLARLLTLRAAQ